jgi:5-methylcytosine-specific restriction endonuclease McrA
MPTGWKGSDRRTTLPPDWAATTLRILRRDHYRCRHIRYDTGRPCGKRATDVDHEEPHSEGGTDDDTNLRALCPYHHLQKTGREGGVASGKARRAKRDQSKPLHPGLIAPSTNAPSGVGDPGDPLPF